LYLFVMSRFAPDSPADGKWQTIRDRPAVRLERLCDLPLAEVDPTYVVSEVLAAMGLLVARRSEEGSQEPPHDEIPNSLSAG
jgi:hypothetical protein